MSDPVAAKVMALVAKRKKLPAESLTPATTFAEIGVDSLDAMEILFALEDEFGLTIPDDVAREMKTVGEATEALRRALGPRAAELV